MAQKRQNSKSKIELKFWKQDGKKWYAERADLEAAIKAGGRTDDDLKRRLGAGYQEMLEALDGKRLDGWSVSHIEWGFRADQPYYQVPSMYSWSRSAPTGSTSVETASDSRPANPDEHPKQP